MATFGTQFFSLKCYHCHLFTTFVTLKTNKWNEMNEIWPSPVYFCWPINRHPRQLFPILPKPKVTYFYTIDQSLAEQKRSKASLQPCLTCADVFKEADKPVCVRTRVRNIEAKVSSMVDRTAVKPGCCGRLFWFKIGFVLISSYGSDLIDKDMY